MTLVCLHLVLCFQCPVTKQQQNSKIRDFFLFGFFFTKKKKKVFYSRLLLPVYLLTSCLNRMADHQVNWTTWAMPALTWAISLASLVVAVLVYRL